MRRLGLLCAPFTSLSLSLSFSLFLSLSHTLSLTLSLSFSLSLSLSLLSLPPSLYLSFYLSPSLSLLSIILFGVSNGRFRPCFIITNKNHTKQFIWFFRFKIRNIESYLFIVFVLMVHVKLKPGHHLKGK